MEKEIRDIEEILEDLSCLARPEVEHFQSQIKNKKHAAAKKILLEYIYEEEANRVIDYFYKMYNRKMQLIEVAVKDIPLEESKKEYLVNSGNSIYHTYIFHRNNDYYFIMEKEMLLVKKAIQVWEIVYQT